jgi:hypothetical protein
VQFVTDVDSNMPLTNSERIGRGLWSAARTLRFVIPKTSFEGFLIRVRHFRGLDQSLNLSSGKSVIYGLQQPGQILGPLIACSLVTLQQLNF